MIERDEEGRPKMYAEILKGKPDLNDPFWDYRFQLGFSLPLARYAYHYVDKEQKQKKQKQ